MTRERIVPLATAAVIVIIVLAFVLDVGGLRTSGDPEPSALTPLAQATTQDSPALLRFEAFDGELTSNGTFRFHCRLANRGGPQAEEAVISVAAFDGDGVFQDVAQLYLRPLGRDAEETVSGELHLEPGVTDIRVELAVDNLPFELAEGLVLAAGPGHGLVPVVPAPPAAPAAQSSPVVQ